MAPPRRASDDRLEQLQGLADTIAAFERPSQRPGGPDLDDAVETLESLITWAQTLSDARPGVIRAVRGGSLPGFVSLRLAVEKGDVPTLAFVVDRPAPQGDDAYPFTAPSYPNMVACPNCKGDGEVIDFPPEADERMVCCPTCGGQGEVPASCD